MKNTEYWVRQMQGGKGLWQAAFAVDVVLPYVDVHFTSDTQEKAVQELLDFVQQERENGEAYGDLVLVAFDPEKHCVPSLFFQRSPHADEQPPEGMGKSSDNLSDEPHHLDSSFLPNEEDPTPTGATKPNRFGLGVDVDPIDVEEGTVVSVVLNVENPSEADIVVTWRKNHTTSTLHTEQPVQQQDAMEIAQLLAHAIKQDREINRTPEVFGGFCLTPEGE